MLQPRPYWTNYVLFEGYPIPVAYLLAWRDIALARLRRQYRRARSRR